MATFMFSRHGSDLVMIHCQMKELYKRFTDIGCKSVVIVPKEAALRSPFKHTLWRGGEGVMRERTLRTLPFNGVNWVASLSKKASTEFEDSPCNIESLHADIEVFCACFQ